MSEAVNISDAEMELLRKAATMQNRSVSEQVEHWLRLGRAVESDPCYGALPVELALKGLLAPMELSAPQQEEYFDRLEAAHLAPSPAAEAFFSDRRRRGVGVGMDEAGDLERACQDHGG